MYNNVGKMGKDYVVRITRFIGKSLLDENNKIYRVVLIIIG